MAQKKITDLQQISAMTDSASFPVDDGIQTYRATGSQLKTYLAPVYIPPFMRKLTSGTTYLYSYAFVVSSVSATVGATYTNNSNTYTVLATIASANLVYMSGSAAPTASGTLTKATGTGDSTIAFSISRAPIYQEVEMAGGGGGGGGSGTGGATAGAAGGTTTFGSQLSCTGGSFGTTGGAGGGGGTATTGTYPGFALSGGAGGGSSYHTTNGGAGQKGGSNNFGGGGGSSFAAAGSAGATNTGAGGGAAGGGVNTYTGSSGGAGGWLKARIHDPVPSTTYAIGGGGANGAAGAGGNAGGSGADGVIFVTDCYQ